MEKFICHVCGLEKPVNHDGGTGYARDKDNNFVCYECCGKQDEQELKTMQPGEKTIHYWNGKEITNWPGTLKIKPYFTKNSRHNIARTRTDIWFNFHSLPFHAVQYGDNSQIAHIKRLKVK